MTLQQERDHFYQEACRLLARSEELCAALSEACTIGERLHRKSHPRLTELHELHIPPQAPIGVSAEARREWLRVQLINAQRMQARAYQMVNEFRDTLDSTTT